MFRVIKDQWNQGFHMTFENGWTVSVQFGKNNYVSDRSNTGASPDAEIAAWDENDNWYKFEQNGDTVNGWNHADAVADFIAMVKAFE
jgi:hypothetical protein